MQHGTVKTRRSNFIENFWPSKTSLLRLKSLMPTWWSSDSCLHLVIKIALLDATWWYMEHWRSFINTMFISIILLICLSCCACFLIPAPLSILFWFWNWLHFSVLLVPNSSQRRSASGRQCAPRFHHSVRLCNYLSLMVIKLLYALTFRKIHQLPPRLHPVTTFSIALPSMNKLSLSDRVRHC